MNREIHREVSGHEIHVKFLKASAWWRSSRWQMLREYRSHNGNVTVPVGFISDGATIPMFLRGTFSPTGNYFGASIIHDYLIDVEKDWGKANVEFELEMKALNVKPWKRIPMVSAVELWGWFRKFFPKGDK